MSLVFQHAFYIGNNFNTILYGVELVLFYLTIWSLTMRVRRSDSDVLLGIFSALLLLLNTVFVATEAVFGEEMWISNRDYDGGPEEYLKAYASVWYQTFGTAASIVLNLFSDALLVYRCYVIWADTRVILFPSLLYLANFSVGIAQLIESGRPHANYFAGLAKQLGIAYTTSIISNQVIVTALICARIVYIARRYETAAAPLARCYTGAVAVVVESALPCTLFGVVYLVTFALDSEISIFFLSIYVMFTCISPQMIILRVVSGRAWSIKTSENIMTSALSNIAGDLSTGFSIIGVESEISQCKTGPAYPQSAIEKV